MSSVVSKVFDVVGQSLAEFSLGNFIVSTALSFGINAVIGMLAKKPKPAISDVGATWADRTVTIRQAAAEAQVVYGACRVGGVIVYVGTADNAPGDLNLVIVLAGHRVDTIGTMYFDGEPVMVGGDGWATGGYADLVYVEKRLGAPDQGVLVKMRQTVADWTDAHRLAGLACVHVMLRQSREKFPNGVPNITFDVIGKLVYDPRSPGVAVTGSFPAGEGLALLVTAAPHGLGAGMQVHLRGHGGAVPGLWGEYHVAEVVDATSLRVNVSGVLSQGGGGGTITALAPSDNPALCAADYQLNRDYGLGVPYEALDDADLVASANVCDEWVDVVGVESVFAVVDPGASGREMEQDEPGVAILAGDRVRVSSTGTLPAGLDAGTTYYFAMADGRRFGLATSRALARAGVTLAIGSVGSGTHTITRLAEPRYTSNGAFSTRDEPQQVIGSLNAAMAGVVVTTMPVRILAGCWRAPTVAMDTGDLRAALGSVRVQASARDAVNGVKGLHAGPWSRWQPADFPAVSDADALAADGDVERWEELDLAYTASPTMASRIAAIYLRQRRREIVLTWPGQLSCLAARAGDVVALDVPRFGWAGKMFFVRHVQTDVVQDAQGAPRIDAALELVETDSGVWGWTSNEEPAVGVSPRTSLPVFRPSPPTNLQVSALPYALAAGVEVTWDAAGSAYVDWYQVEYRAVGDGSWKVAGRTSGLEFAIDGLEPGDYYFRVCSLSRFVSSDYATTARTVVVRPDVMPRVSGLELRGGYGNGIEFTGPAAHLVWRDAARDGAHDLGAEPYGADGGRRDHWFRDYEVRVVGADGAVLRTEYTANAWYDYDLLRNREDHGGVASRRVTFEVRQRGMQGQLSQRPARIAVTNPAPGLPTAVKVSAAFRTVWLDYVGPGDPDYQGMLVWMSGASGFECVGSYPGEGTCVYRGSDSPISLPAAAGAVYYLRFAAFDAFGADELVVSAEYMVTTGRIGQAELDAAAVTTAALADGAVDAAKLAALSVTAAALANGAVGSGALADGAVGAAKLAALSVTAAALANGAVGSDAIAAAAIDAAHIKAAAVGSAAIATAAVGTAHIANGAVTNLKVADAAIDGAKIADGAVTRLKVADAAIGAAQIGNLEVGDAHIASVSVDKLTAGTLTAATIFVGGATFALSAANRNIVITDTQGSPVTRVELGRLGGGAEDYGIVVRGADGAVILSASGLGASTVGTTTIAPDAVTRSWVVSGGSGTAVSTEWRAVSSLAVTVSADAVGVMVSAVVTLGPIAFGRASGALVRISRAGVVVGGDANGNLFAGLTYSLSVMIEDSPPAGDHTYLFDIRLETGAFGEDFSGGGIVAREIKR